MYKGKAIVEFDLGKISEKDAKKSYGTTDKAKMIAIDTKGFEENPENLFYFPIKSFKIIWEEGE